jgi:hypothetical protein
MTHPDNGWFARTIANRLWARLLGRGLVHPVDAIGKSGQESQQLVANAHEDD